MEQLPTREHGTPDLPGDWVSESLLPQNERAAEPDWLARFPSEVCPPEAVFDQQVASAIVEQSPADRQRLLSSTRPMPVIAPRLVRAAVFLLVTVALGVTGAIVVLGVLVPSPSQSASDALTSVPAGTLMSVPTSAPASEAASAPDSPPAGVIAPPIQQTVSSGAPSATETRHAPPRRDVAVPSQSTAATPSNPPLNLKTAPRPSAAPLTSTPSAAIWPPPAMARAKWSESTTPLDAPAGRASATPPPVSSPPPSPPPPAPRPAATVAPSEPTPVVSPEVTARIAKTASVQSVLDRYRNAFDSLDANGVEAFWPGADVRALNRAFAQIESQRLQFDHCDINLAGVRAFASCDGYAEYTRKAGTRDVRLEPRHWAFTLGEGKNGWVILGVDARQAR